MTNLADYGWDEYRTKHASTDTVPDDSCGRVIADYGTSMKVALPEVIRAQMSGSLSHSDDTNQTPKVGDWVMLHTSADNHYTVTQVLPRSNELARKVSGERTLKQVVASNVDIGFIVVGLDSDFSPERIKRFLYQLQESHITPVIVLNKSDTAGDLTEFMSDLDSLHVTTIVTSALSDDGITAIREHISTGKTAVLLGSSGVGKSTITNLLIGDEIQRTQAIRERDGTGKHTTVHRELFLLPGGGMLVDMPGVRELQLWGSESSLGDKYDLISQLIAVCKFSSCRHGDEPDCAIRAALENGNLLPADWAAYKKMQAELDTLTEKRHVKNQLLNKISRRDQRKRSRDQARDIRDQTNYL